METYQIFQIGLSACSGMLGVGIGIGLFKSSITQIRKDVDKIVHRQARLRGEDNGGVPIYMTTQGCNTLRSQCEGSVSGKIQDLQKDLCKHTKSIRAFDNFARWWMQKEGVRLEDVNKILGS